MGRVQVHCLTSTPDTSTIYGLTGGYSSSTAKQRNVRDVMSQQNPKAVSDIQWTAVAQFSLSVNLNDMFNSQDPNIACAVSSAGVFTMLFYANVTGSLNGGTLLEGIRYTSPAGAPTPGIGRLEEGGQWTTIDVDPKYKRTTATPNYEGHKLFYVQGGAKETLYHATYDSSRAVHLGIMQEAGSRPLLQTSISFKSDVLQLNNDVGSLAYGNGNLYVYAAGPVPDLLSLSLTSISTPTIIKRFNASSTVKCQDLRLLSAVWRDSYYLLCTRKLGYVGPGPFTRLEYVHSPSMNTSTTPMMDYVGGVTKTFLPIGISDLSFAPYAILTTGKYIQSMTLMQLKQEDPAGGFVDRPYGVWVEGVYGEGPDEVPLIPNTADEESSGSQLSTSELLLIILGIVMIVVGVAATLYYVRRRRRLRQQRLEQEKKDDAATAVELNKTELDQDAAIDIGVASRPMTIVVMPTVAAASAPSLEVLDKTAPTLETLDKGTPPPYNGFATHPRPTIV
ncbi:MAG: hypothetical protein J3R72DRAFT_475326, partial [Linnemannia gamsii]